MKIFRVKADVNNYQWIMPDVPESALVNFRFDCTPRLQNWKPPEVFAFNPLKEEGDFLHFGSDVLLASPKATEIVRTFFEMAGELLPIFYADKEYTLLNVLECVNALDNKRTKKTTWITKYYFHANRFSESPIFKIPEETGSVLTLERNGCPECEFKACVEANNLTGLIFEEIWGSETLSKKNSHGQRIEAD